jgi:hypothetical protein
MRDRNAAAMAEDCDVVTAGFTPSGSGDLHQGHYLTLTNIGRTLNAHPSMQARIFIDDREFSLQTPAMVPAEPAVERTSSQLTSYMHELGRHFHNSSLAKRLGLVRMSEFFAKPGIESPQMSIDLYRTLRKHQENSTDLRGIFHDVRLNKTRNMIRAVCPECGIGMANATENRLVGKSQLPGECKNDRCDESAYSVDALRGDTAWCLHYMFVGMRDVLLAKQADESILHMYGGDYALEWGEWKTSKVDRIRELVRLAMQGSTSGKVLHATGPLMVRNGDKLAKSKGDCGKASPEAMLAILETNDSVVDVASLPGGRRES